MTQRQRNTLYRRLIETPCTGWEAILAETRPASSDMNVLREQASAEVFQLVGLAAYLYWRSGDGFRDLGHLDAMRGSENAVQRARFILGHMYTSS